MDLPEFITIVLGILTFGFSSYQYFDTRKRTQDLKEFETYHKLIKELVQPEDDKGAMYTDRQAAIIFELRNFKRYYSFSYRTLLGLKETWSPSDGKSTRLFEEIKLSLEFLEKHK